MKEKKKCGRKRIFDKKISILLEIEQEMLEEFDNIVQGSRNAYLRNMIEKEIEKFKA